VLEIHCAQPYFNNAPEPIVRGDAHIQECFDIVGRCMGSSVGEQSSYPESHDTMVTGAHGKKASYVTTPTKCRPQGYGTLYRHKEEIKRMERAEQKDPNLFQTKIEANRKVKRALDTNRSQKESQGILKRIKSENLVEKKKIIQQSLESGISLSTKAIKTFMGELGLQLAYRKSKEYYSKMALERRAILYRE